MFVGSLDHEIRTKILYILISDQGKRTACLTSSSSLACAESFIDNNSIRCRSCYESSAVGKSRPAGVRMESDVR